MDINFVIIQPGTKYIRARKFVKGQSEVMYSSTDCEFNLHSEDVRVINMKHSEVKSRRSSRATTITTAKVCMFGEDEIGQLKLKCWKPLNNNE